MRDIQSVLKEKESQLQQLQREIEALKLAAKLLSEYDTASASVVASSQSASAPVAVANEPALRVETFFARSTGDTRKQFP